MAVQTGATGQPATTGQNWYARTPDEVATALNVDPDVGLTAARAAELLRANGPNALPEEKQKPGWLHPPGPARRLTRATRQRTP